MSFQEIKLLKWRQRLPASNQINSLVEEARMVIGYYFRSPTVSSHVVIKRELSELSKGLARAAKALTTLGPHALLRLHAAAGLIGDETTLQKLIQSGQLVVLARWAGAAASIIPQRRPDNEKRKPGPPGDIRLKHTAWLLAWLYENRIERAAYWTNANEEDSMFKDFLKSAFSDFKPDGVNFPWRKLDRAAQLAIRELRSEAQAPS